MISISARKEYNQGQRYRILSDFSATARHDRPVESMHYDSMYNCLLRALSTILAHLLTQDLPQLLLLRVADGRWEDDVPFDQKVSLPLDRCGL
jgi:hypothetical protein